MIGKTFGDYRILEKRGEGGMGMFYRAVDLRLDRIVGLKTLRAELLDDPGVLERLQSEAKSLARLDHPNIARLLHYLVAEGQHFIVMEYVDGPDLAAKVRQEGLLPLPTLAAIVHQICAAIGYAHSKSVIHRDIKPSNVLLAGDGTVKVTDFGIAKILGVSARTRTGMATGSLPYMAPEQIRGSGVDPRTDIYQLGVALFELTTGRRPFVAESEYEMMTMHLEAEPPKPSSINPHLSPTVDQVIAKALAKAPADRYPSAAEMDTALQAALVGVRGASGSEPIAPSHTGRVPDRDQTAVPPSREDATVFPSSRDSAPPSAPRETPLQPKKTKRWIALAAGGAILAIVLGVFLFRSPAERPPRSEEPTSPRTTAVQPAQITVGAQMPPEAGDRVRLITLTTVHPSAGTLVDTVVATQGVIRKRLSLPPAHEVHFALRGFNAAGVAVVEGETGQTAPEGGSVTVNVPLRLLQAPPAERPEERQPEKHPEVRRDTATTAKKETRPPSGQPTTEPNLTIDVQPFTARDLVDQLWIDGRKVAGKLPLKTRVDPGVRFIRWQIGRDRFTDTVTVDATGTAECALFAEPGEGRLNVTASFADGGYGEIWLDGVDMGQGTPAELRGIPTGPHEVTVRREGYRMRSQPPIARVKTNDRARVEVEMIPEE